MTHSYWAFLGVSALVIVTPGPDTALTIRNTLRRGRSAGVTTALGVITGQLAWACVASAGLTAALLASSRVFGLLKLAGTGYLIGLGVVTVMRALRGSRGADAGTDAATASPTEASRAAAPFWQGLFSNLANPKMVLFFASVFPAFAPSGRHTFLAMMSLGVVFATLTVVWLSLYAVVVAAAARRFSGSRFQRVFEVAAGVALIALGARLGAEGS